jgi:hypothetical protein
VDAECQAPVAGDAEAQRIKAKNAFPQLRRSLSDRTMWDPVANSVQQVGECLRSKSRQEETTAEIREFTQEMENLPLQS